MLNETPFLSIPRLLENEFAFAVDDGFPVSRGHTLIVSKRVVADYFELSKVEKSSLWQLVDEMQAYLKKAHGASDFNIGINCGEAAGQTIAHVHIHLIPRYPGDTANPRGGVRGVIPDKQGY